MIVVIFNFYSDNCFTHVQIFGWSHCVKDIVLHIKNMSFPMLLSNSIPKAFHFINFKLGIKNVKLTYKCAN